MGLLIVVGFTLLGAAMLIRPLANTDKHTNL